MKNYFNMEKNFQNSIGASSFLSFNQKYFPSHKEGNQNLCHLPGGDFSTEEKCEKELEPLNKSLTSMDWLQKLNADYITQRNSKSDQLKNYLNMEETNYRYSTKGSSLLFDRKKLPSHEEDNQNSFGKFSTDDSLKNQTTLDHEKKKFYGCLRWPYKCNVCDDSFSQEKCTKPHITSVHDKKKPCKRSVCDTSTSEKAKFKKTIEAVLEKIKPYKCSICNDAYSSNSQLNEHFTSVHKDENPFDCKICSKSFVSKQSLNGHMSVVHYVKNPYECNVCYRNFSNEHQMSRHLAAVHEDIKKHKCLQCNASFSKSQGLKKHINAIHHGKKLQVSKPEVITISTDDESDLESTNSSTSKQNSSSTFSTSESKEQYFWMNNILSERRINYIKMNKIQNKEPKSQNIETVHEDKKQLKDNSNFNELIIITTDDESDLEGTNQCTSKSNISSTSSGAGSKKEGHFWMYNLKGKGPKDGPKITFEPNITDPRVFSEIVDPVFSDEVKLQAIKQRYMNCINHKGKGRKGEGNDLTSNPKKLAAIGKELDQLKKKKNNLKRGKSQKEKHKLDSRVCRLKKKASHEANKLKCEGLTTEHNDLVAGIANTKALLLEKANPYSVRSQEEITDELDRVVSKAISLNVAGNTSHFVQKMIEKHMSEV